MNGRTVIMGNVEFTRDMVETLATFFDTYAVEGVLTVEVSNRGLWLPNRHTKSRQFLGLARLSNDIVQ